MRLNRKVVLGPNKLTNKTQNHRAQAFLDLSANKKELVMIMKRRNP